MSDFDPDQIKGLAVVGVILLGIFLLTVVTAWQSSHCMFCNQWLSWRAIRDMKYACENRGQCRLENLARKIRSGEI